MKKTLIALAAVAATGAAFAQSSVTVYGKVDVGVARNIGENVTKMQEASGSRLGFKGTEDLGGGLKANFILEHRFSPDTGAANATYWHGRSIVGLEGGFGRVDMGRDYTAAFWTQLGADPFGWDGVAKQSGTTGMGVAAARFANVVNYTTPAMGGFKVQASYAFKEGGTDTGTAIRASYAAGPFSVEAAAERGLTGAEWNGVAGSYNFGVAKANLLVASGQTAAGVDTDSVVVGLVVPMGALTLKAAYGSLEVGNVKTSSKLSLGARYALSKRTDLYTSYARDSKVATNKSGIEFGLQHNF